MEKATEQQAGANRLTGALHSPKGEGRKSAQPSTRKRSCASHRGQPLPAAPQLSSQTVMGSLTLEITAPVQPTSWKELKDLLWASANAVTEGQRAVISELMAVDVRKDVDEFSATHAYRIMVRAMEERRERFRSGSNQSERDSGLYLHTGNVLVVASKTSSDAFGKWKKERWKKGPPWYKKPGIPFHNRGFKLERAKEGVICSLGLLGKDADNHRQLPVRVRVAARGGSAWSTLHKILNGEWEKRSARVIYDDNERKWLVKLSFRHLVEPAMGGNTMVIRRGIRNFLPMMVDDGSIPAGLDTGQSIIAKKREIDGRKKKLSQRLPHQGRGARGHGKKRYYRSQQALRDKEARFVNTWCQQQAAHVVKMSERYGCSTVLVEDFPHSEPPNHPDPFIQKLLRRFPFALLMDKVEYALTKSGRQLVKVASDHNCQRCPKCGNVDPSQHDRGKLWFTCKECHTTGPSDLVAMWNTLVDHGIRPEAVEALAAKAEAMRKAVERRKHGKKAEED
jgi:transposase